MNDVEFREVGNGEEVLIYSFLTIATRMAEAGEPIQKALADPKITKYWRGWGRPGDFGVVAIEKSSGMPVSCAWVRQFSKEEAQDCFFGDGVPELATGTVAEFRNKGIGKATLEMLISSLQVRQPQVKRICLSVRHDNPAVRLYEKLGFVRVSGSTWKNRVGTASFNMTKVI